jgi:hypothetical protein
VTGDGEVTMAGDEDEAAVERAARRIADLQKTKPAPQAKAGEGGRDVADKPSDGKTT